MLARPSGPAEDPHAEYGSRGARLRPLAILLGLVVVFLGPKVLPLGGRFIGGMDVAGYSFWSLFFFKEQILGGALPLWNPYLACGQPFMANPVNFAFYPPVLLYLALPLPWAFNLDLLLHLVVAGMGAFSLTRVVTGSGPAAFVAAIAFSLGASMTERIAAGHVALIHATAWLPWILYFVERAVVARPLRNLVLAGLCFGLQILSGYMQGSMYTGYLVAFYFIVRSLGHSGVPSPALAVRRLGAFLVVPATGVALAAVALLPAWTFLALSNRAQGSYAFATDMSVAPQNLFLFLAPRPSSSALHINWEFGCYLGILPLLLAPIGVLWFRNRRAVVAWVSLLLVALLFALGGHTPLYRAVYEVLPLIDRIRVPARALVFVALCLSVLAGMGAQHVIECLNRKRHLRFIVAALPIAAAALVGGAWWLQVALTSRAMLLAYLVGAVSFVTLLALLRIGDRRVAGTLLVAMLFLDLYLTGASGLPLLVYDDLMRRHAYEQTLEKDPGDHRVMIPIGRSRRDLSLASRSSALHLRNAGGYAPGLLGDYYTFLHAMADLPEPRMRRHTPSRRLFRAEKAFTSRILGVKYALVDGPEGPQLLTSPWHMPGASLVHRAKIVPQYRDHLVYLKDAAFDPLRTVLLERDFGEHVRTLPEDHPDVSVGDSVVTLSYGSNRIDLKTSSPHASYLLLSELYYPGWRAVVDGQPVPVLRAHYLLRAVPLPAGRHRVTVELGLESLAVGALITLATLAGAGVVLRTLRRPR